MHIISKIEISYFRSVYSVNLNQTNHLNVLIGGHDSGKSNILKALNLFFNNNTELNTRYSFNDDLSKIREKEVKEVKGKATIWIKVTFNNFLHWRSLPEQFSIKRSWNRYESGYADSYSNNLPATTIGKFLNKLSFHYIPAVRGRDIFAHYLQELHDALIDDEKAGVRASANDLLGAINRSTIDMSEKIMTGLEIQSSIQVPEDLRQLFSTLDFSTKFSGYDVPLQKRGDGIQARHIPFILDFIARHSKKYHIWAYEEPENSLEMSRAFQLSKQFETDFSKENQIFLTTHSPAFYDLSGKNVTKWHIRSIISEEGNRTSASVLSDNLIADESLGIAGLIADRAKELFEQIERHKESEHDLSMRLTNARLHQVLVEGPTDKELLETAFNKLFPNEDPFCEFVSVGGASNVTYCINAYKYQQREFPFCIIGVFDNDNAGREGFRNFTKYKTTTGDFKEIVNSKIFCGLLVTPEFLNDVYQSLRQNGLNNPELPISIEYLFSDQIINQAIEQEVITLNSQKQKTRSQIGLFDMDISAYMAQKLPENYRYLAYEIDDNSKRSFTRWASNLDANHFEGFRPILSRIRSLCR